MQCNGTMERIYQIKAAFETSFHSFTEYRMTKAWPNRKEQPMRVVKDLIQFANEFLQEYQMLIIERAAKESSISVYSSEIERIENHFSLEGYTKAYPKINPKTQIQVGHFVEHYNYELLISDLKKGEISEGITFGGLDFAAFIYSETLKYHWLQNTLNKNQSETRPMSKRLIWNGKSNALADIFFQLRELKTDSGESFLEGSNDDLAEFLINNFACFEGNKLSTVRTYFDRSKPNMRPQLGKNKLTITRGNPHNE